MCVCACVCAPRFGISLGGVVNPAHFEAPGAADAPPEGCPGPRPGPASGESSWPVLLVADFVGDKWYSARRFVETQALYSDATLLEHSQEHQVPSLGAEAAAAARRFLERLVAA